MFRKQKAKANVSTEPTLNNTNIVTLPQENPSIGGELIAVFAAAIAAMTGESASGIRVCSYRKTGQTAPIWNVQGRHDYIGGKL